MNFKERFERMFAHIILGEKKTGLHDKNGIPIYEYDIVDVTKTKEKYQVIYSILDGCYVLYKKHIISPLSEYSGNDLEIIR